MSALLSQNELPSPRGGFEVSPTFFLVPFGLGFAIGVLGQPVPLPHARGGGRDPGPPGDRSDPVYLQATR